MAAAFPTRRIVSVKFRLLMSRGCENQAEVRTMQDDFDELFVKISRDQTVRSTMEC